MKNIRRPLTCIAIITALCLSFAIGLMTADVDAASAAFSSNKRVAWAQSSTAKKYLLVGPGETDIVVTSGKTFHLIVSGTPHEKIQNYISFVEGWPSDSRIKGKSEYDKVKNTIDYIYSLGKNQSGADVWDMRDIGGDCGTASTMLLQLCEEMGIACEVRYASEVSGANVAHVNCFVWIDGVKYIGDANAGYLMTWDKYKAWRPTAK